MNGLKQRYNLGRFAALTIALALALAALSACTSPSHHHHSTGQNGGTTVAKDGWIGAWGAAPYGPFPAGPLTSLGAPIDPLGYTALSLVQNQQAVDQSFRMIVHPTTGGDEVRIRLSNLMGDRVVTIQSVKVAKRAVGPALIPGTSTPLLFDGMASVDIPIGEEVVSDPVAFSFAFGEDLAVSYHVVGESGPMTWHAVSFGLNFVGLPMVGDLTDEPTGAGFVAQPTIGWFFLSGIDVYRPESKGSVVAVGDSITDGAYEIPESNTRWPDFLAQRFAAENVAMGVINEGINSNRVTGDGGPSQGPSLVQRFQRDVLDRPGVRSVLIFEGTNDLGANVDAETVYAALMDLTSQAKAQGLCVVLATIPPRDGPIGDWNQEEKEPQRRALNALIRATTGIEGIADFDVALASPTDPNFPNPLLYSPDLLHPNSLGFQAMANVVPIDSLVPAEGGACSNGT